MLSAVSNVHLLGHRPYEEVPAYLQHADVLIVPHIVSPFTESLDPIKAYECLVVETPTVATPVAGFRELERAVDVAPRAEFVKRVESALSGDSPAREYVEPTTWGERALAFGAAISRACGRLEDSCSSGVYPPPSARPRTAPHG